MNIIKRIAYGTFIDVRKEIYDFANEEVLSKIRTQLFTEPHRPTFFELSAEEMCGIKL